MNASEAFVASGRRCFGYVKEEMMRPIEITKMSKVNGTNSVDVYHVKVGCKNLFYNDVAALIVDLQNYMLKPELVEKEVLSKDVGAQSNPFRLYPPVVEQPCDSATNAPEPECETATGFSMKFKRQMEGVDQG